MQVLTKNKGQKENKNSKMSQILAIIVYRPMNQLCQKKKKKTKKLEERIISTRAWYHEKMQMIMNHSYSQSYVSSNKKDFL